jgi:hypothetical protein
MRMDELFYEHWQEVFFGKNQTKETRLEEIYVGLFRKNRHMKC